MTSSPLAMSSRTRSSGNTLTPQPACTARTWPSLDGTKSCLSMTRGRPKDWVTNSCCRWSLRLKATNGTLWKLCAFSPLGQWLAA
ncbi:hypothetical protein D9M68_969560 [compost metagenome]